MKYDKYNASVSTQALAYYFTSTGRNGEIPKIIQYSYVTYGIFNLAFGVQRPDGTFDDQAISNNGDMEKILATVGATVYNFTNEYPDTLVIVKGSTPARTRLYRKMLTLNHKEIMKDFIIFGQKDGKWEKFVKNQDYEGFLVKRK